MKKPKILIVDDNAILLETTAAILQDAGYDAITQDRAVGTGAAIVREHPDLVLLDYNMPCLKGDAILKQIRDNRKLSDTKIVFFSGAREAQRIATAAGADGYVEKGMSPEALLVALEKFLKPAVDRSGGSARLLCVDDDLLFLRALERMLRNTTHNLLCCTSPSAALEHIRKNNADIVVSDLVMPEITGTALYDSAIQSDKKWSNRFIFVTGVNAAKQDLQAKVRAPIVEKPIEHAILMQTLERVSKHAGL